MVLSGGKNLLEAGDLSLRDRDAIPATAADDANRAGDAYGVEVLATQRLASEYTEAQDRGEVVGPHTGATKRIPEGNSIATISDIGLTPKDIFEGRRLIAAEAIAPGIVRRTL